MVKLEPYAHSVLPPWDEGGGGMIFGVSAPEGGELIFKTSRGGGLQGEDPNFRKVQGEEGQFYAL